MNNQSPELDATTEPNSTPNSTTARYTHGHHRSVVAVHARRSAQDSAAFLLPHLRPGMDLLDVGCGPGSITLDLAQHVAPGRVLGVDAAPAVLAQAAATARQRRDHTTRFAVADIYRLGLPDASFDVVYAHQVLQHLGDPVAALREMTRVTRPGGLIAVRDAVFATFCWYPPDEGLTRWRSLYRQVARANGGDPDAGRALAAWARQAGLRDLTGSTSTWSYHDLAGRQWLADSWAQRITQSAFADRAVATGLTDRAELAELAAAWHRWAAHPDGWLAIVHGEVIARVPAEDDDTP